MKLAFLKAHGTPSLWQFCLGTRCRAVGHVDNYTCFLFNVCRMMNQWQGGTVPARFPSPAHPQTTPPASARPAPVPRAARGWAAAGAQRKASRLGLLPLQDWMVVEEEEEEVQQEKLKKRPKTEWQRYRDVLVSSGTASAPSPLFAATAGVLGRTTEATQRWTSGGETAKASGLYSIFKHKETLHAYNSDEAEIIFEKVMLSPQVFVWC